MAPRLIYITGTDTGVGKTIATAAIALSLRQQGLKVGVIKPVQCAGDDAAWLKKTLELPQPLSIINPIYAKEPLSPHFALRRARRQFKLSLIQSSLKAFDDYDVVLLEGAGGLLVPLSDNYTNANLAQDLNAELIIVSRRGLGTINHTQLTINAAAHHGLSIIGLIFNDAQPTAKSIPVSTNPNEIKRMTGVPVIAQIPFIKNVSRPKLLNHVKDFHWPKTTKANETLQLKELDKKYIWHPFTQMKDWLADSEQPLVINRAKGVYLYDTDGKKYIDGVSSLWVNVHGHGHPHIDRAIKQQVDKLSHSTFLGLSHDPAIKLAEELIHIAPKGLSKVFYSDNGSTAVEIALKQAYQYFQNTGQPKKQTLVHLTNSYHGDTLGSVSVGGIALFHQVYRGLIFKTHGLPGQGKETVKAFEAYLKKNATTTAALIIEPLVQGAAGMLMWPRGVLKKFRQLCTQYNVFLIVDEVATGFGRTGTMFACEHEGVTPDFLCIAKGITGGYLPLAATLTTQKIYDGFCFDYKDFKTFFHGHTYTANPLACSAALANLAIFRKEQTLAQLAPKIKHLAKSLKMFYNLPSVADVRQLGFMVGIELKGRLNDRIGAKVCQRARQYGVIIRPLGNVIVLLPPLSITTEELNKLINATFQAIKDYE